MIVTPDQLAVSSLQKRYAGSHRLTVAEYHRLVEHAVLTTNDKVELLDGYVLYKLDHVKLPPPSLYFPQWQQLRQWTLDEYQRMTELGVLTPEDRIELLDGYLVKKMPQNTQHRASVLRLTTRLTGRLPVGWLMMPQCPLVVGTQDPEPDGSVLRGTDSDYDRRDPTSEDCGLVIEVADSSLRTDRTLKADLYSAAGIPIYWIINVVDRQIEVYTDPDLTTPLPSYRTRTDYLPGQVIPFILDGQTIAQIPVADLLP
jgi:Uma2 family endonuclease